jgi:hypothetical protein
MLETTIHIVFPFCKTKPFPFLQNLTAEQEWNRMCAFFPPWHS